MRVICIDDDAWPPNMPYEAEDGILKNGETYNVVDVFFDEGYIWYELENDLGSGYWENCFARTSEIDEKELLKERQKEAESQLIAIEGQ